MFDGLQVPITDVLMELTKHLMAASPWCCVYWVHFEDMVLLYISFLSLVMFVFGTLFFFPFFVCTLLRSSFPLVAF